MFSLWAQLIDIPVVKVTSQEEAAKLVSIIHCFLGNICVKTAVGISQQWLCDSSLQLATETTALAKRFSKSE